MGSLKRKIPCKIVIGSRLIRSLLLHFFYFVFFYSSCLWCVLLVFLIYSININFDFSHMVDKVGIYIFEGFPKILKKNFRFAQKNIQTDHDSDIN